MKSKIITSFFVLSLLCGGIFSYLASSNPDGLEKVAEERGFIDVAEENSIGIIADYAFPINNEFLSVSLAGIIGVLLMFGSIYILYKCII